MKKKASNCRTVESCDYCGQRPATYPVSGVVLCRDCFNRIVDKTDVSEDEKPDEQS
jgi:ribosomal protein S14